MPTVFSHAAIGFFAAKVPNGAGKSSSRMTVAAIILAAMPDADALFINIVPYNSPFGHRGFTHSIFFAAVIGVLSALLFSKAHWAPERSFWFLASLFTIATASHGFFDAMTDGGLGVAFFAPFSNTRYFFPWRPIPVAPLSLAPLATARGVRVIYWELGLFWTFGLAAFIWDRKAIWRIVLSIACTAIGIAMWILAI
jgi:inner membrane protein